MIWCLIQCLSCRGHIHCTGFWASLFHLLALKSSHTVDVMGVSESVHFMQCMTFLTHIADVKSTGGRLVYCKFFSPVEGYCDIGLRPQRWAVSISAAPKKTRRKHEDHHAPPADGDLTNDEEELAMERSFGCINPKRKLDNTLWPCCLAKEKKHTNKRLRERERWGVFRWLLVLLNMKTSGATDTWDDWNCWVESYDLTRGPMKMTWTRWEQGKLEITCLLEN